MTAIDQTFRDALKQIGAAILENHSQILKEGLALLTACMAEAVESRQFHLIDIANRQLREKFDKLSILQRTKDQTFSVDNLGLLLEHIAPLPHKLWNAGIKDMPRPMINLLVENCFKFWPNNHESHYDLIRQFQTQDLQEFRALVFEKYLLNCTKVDRSEYEHSPFADLDLIFNETTKGFQHGLFSQPVIDVFLKHETVALKQVKRDIKFLKGKYPENQPFNRNPIPFQAVQQLHAQGVTKLAPLLYPTIIGTNEIPRQFTLAEDMGVVIDPDFVKKAITNARRDGYTEPALAYVVESEKYAPSDLSDLLSNLRDNIAVSNLLEAVGPALQAAYELPGARKNPLLHKKTHALMDWMASLDMNIGPARSEIMKIKNIPQHLFANYPSFLEERLLRDVGL